MSENEEIYTAGKNFTLPPAVTGVTNNICDRVSLLYFMNESHPFSRSSPLTT